MSFLIGETGFSAMRCVVFGSGFKGNLTYFRKQFAGKKNITIFVCRLKSSIINQ